MARTRKRTFENNGDTRSFQASPLVRGGLASAATLGAAFMMSGAPAQAGGTVINCNLQPTPAGCRDTGNGFIFDPGQPAAGVDINPALINASNPPTAQSVRDCQRLLLGGYGADPSGGRSFAYRVKTPVARRGSRTVSGTLLMADMQLNAGPLSEARDPQQRLLFAASCAGELVDVNARLSVVDRRRIGGKMVTRVIGSLSTRFGITDAQTGYKPGEFLDRLWRQTDRYKAGPKDSDLVRKGFRIKLKRPLSKYSSIRTTVTTTPKRTAIVAAASTSSTGTKEVGVSISPLPRKKKASLYRRIKVK